VTEQMSDSEQQETAGKHPALLSPEARGERLSQMVGEDHAPLVRKKKLNADDRAKLVKRLIFLGVSREREFRVDFILIAWKLAELNAFQEVALAEEAATNSGNAKAQLDRMNALLMLIEDKLAVKPNKRKKKDGED
jgi:hypothetical protein